MSAFVDTSALYALLVADEQRHAEVARALRGLLATERTLWTTSYVLLETVALLQSRIGLPSVRDLVDHVVPLLSVEWVGEPLHRRGVERLLREDRRRLSLVDCISLEFMRSQGVRDALALDAHFSEMGHRLLPGARG